MARFKSSLDTFLRFAAGNDRSSIGP